MLRKRPLISQSYLGCPLRYLKTVLIFLCVCVCFCHSTTVECLKMWIIIFFFVARYIPFLCICTGGVCIHFYHWIHIVVYYIAILPLVTIYVPKHNLFNIAMLNSLAIYLNLKLGLLINFLFCIIQNRAIKFWGAHFSIRITTPSEHGNVTKAIIKYFRLKLKLYIKFSKCKIIWYPGRC